MSLQKASEEGCDIDFCRQNTFKLENSNLTNSEIWGETSTETTVVKKKPVECHDWTHEEEFYNNEPLPDQFDKYLPNIKEESEMYGLDSAWQSNRSIPVIGKDNKILQEVGLDQPEKPEERRMLTIDRDTPDILHAPNYSFSHKGIQKASTGESFLLQSRFSHQAVIQQESPLANQETKEIEIQTDPLDIDSLIKSIGPGPGAFSKKKKIDTKTTRPKCTSFMSPRNMTKNALQRSDGLNSSYTKRGLDDRRDSCSINPRNKQDIKEISPGMLSSALSKLLSKSGNKPKRSEIVNLTNGTSPVTSTKKLKSFEPKKDLHNNRKMVSLMKVRTPYKGNKSVYNNSISGMKSSKADTSFSSSKNDSHVANNMKQKPSNLADIYNIDTSNNLFSLKFSRSPTTIKLSKPKSNLLRGAIKQNTTTNTLEDNLSDKALRSSTNTNQEDIDPSIYQNSVENSRVKAKKIIRQQQRENLENRAGKILMADLT